MQFSREMIAKAKQAKSAEELLAMAKAENFPMTEEESQFFFDALNRQGEISDDELDAVAGAGKSKQPENTTPKPLYSKGQYVSWGNARCEICDIGEYSEQDGYRYYVRVVLTQQQGWVWENQLSW